MIPLPAEVATELDRLVGRWHQLPIDQAVSVAPQVFSAVQRVVDATAYALGMPSRPLPALHEDHGPAVVLEQLRVVSYDAIQAGDDTLTATLAAELTALRRSLS